MEWALLILGCISIFGLALYAIYAYSGTMLFILLYGLGMSFEPYSIELIAVPIVLGLIVIADWSFFLIYAGEKFTSIYRLMIVVAIPLVLSVLTLYLHSYLLDYEPLVRMILSEILSLVLYILAPLLGAAYVRRNPV
jgi:hypothetical protein